VDGPEQRDKDFVVGALGGFACGKAGAQFFAGDAFATIGLGDALFESEDNLGAAGGEVLFLGFEEIEGVGEEVGRLAEGSAVKLALDSLFGGGVWRDDHEGIIGLRCGEAKQAGGRPQGWEFIIPFPAITLPASRIPTMRVERRRRYTSCSDEGRPW